jgi:hypothetical protein
VPFYSLTFVVLLASAVLYYRAGEFEGASGITWAGLSVLISVVIWRWLEGGMFAVLIGQAGLFAALTLYRTHRNRNQ